MATNKQLNNMMRSIGREVGMNMKAALQRPPRPKKPYTMKRPHPLSVIKQKNKQLARLGYLKNPTKEMYNEIVSEILAVKKAVKKARRW